MPHLWENGVITYIIILKIILTKILEIIPRGKQLIVGKALALTQVILSLVILIQTSHSKRNFQIQILGGKREV